MGTNIIKNAFLFWLLMVLRFGVHATQTGAFDKCPNAGGPRVTTGAESRSIKNTEEFEGQNKNGGINRVRDTDTSNFIQRFILRTIEGVLPAIVIVVLGSLFALRRYHKQRQHEQIIERYLEQGVDLVAANLDHALGVFTENYKQSIRILKLFKNSHDCELGLVKEVYSRKFAEYDQKSFYTTPHYKLRTLVGDDIFWVVAQYLFIFVDKTTDFFENDLCVAIREYEEGKKIEVSHEELFNEYMQIIQNYMNEFYKYQSILSNLQDVIWELENNPPLYKELGNFRNRHTVQQTVEKLKQKFKEEGSAELIG